MEPSLGKKRRVSTIYTAAFIALEGNVFEVFCYEKKACKSCSIINMKNLTSACTLRSKSILVQNEFGEKMLDNLFPEIRSRLLAFGPLILYQKSTKFFGISD